MMGRSSCFPERGINRYVPQETLRHPRANVPVVPVDAEFCMAFLSLDKPGHSENYSESVVTLSSADNTELSSMVQQKKPIFRITENENGCDSNLKARRVDLYAS